MTDESPEQKTDSLSALKGMVSFFTLFHLDITQRDMDSMDERFHLVPIVGAIYSVITMVVIALGLYVMKELGVGSPMMIGIFCLASVYIFSKFLHFDGLTDFGDGMIVSGSPEKHVHALKDSLVGAGGIGVALTVVLISVGIYASIPVQFLVLIIPFTEIMVKFAQVVAAAIGKPGNGMAGRQVGNTDSSSVVWAFVITAVLFMLLWIPAEWVNRGLLTGVVVPDIFGTDLFFLMLMEMLAAAVVGIVMARIANRNFGMVNGDILGATNEISRPVVMMTALLVIALVV